ncbi:MAG: hypothetical protein DHS20C01_32560 [marine bacterium B5-7]|nr:MAG: hypothetical protein DHS20C01_32560 [marine bacterium B5-7]
MSSPKPVSLVLHQSSRALEIEFDDGAHYELSCEYLRVHSPSAEVQGHGPGQETLQLNKQNVNITQIEPVGAYAVCLHFDDGHNTGIYSWETLYRLGADKETNWKRYLERLEEAGHGRPAEAG